MRHLTSPRALGRTRLRWAAAALMVALAAGCAPGPLPFEGPLDIRTVEVTVKEVPPAEVYYHRRQPPGVLGYLGTAAFMGSTVYRSWADSQQTEAVGPSLTAVNAAEEVVGPFVEALRKSGVFRRVDVRRAGQDSGLQGPYDGFIELLVDRWGMTYATEGQVSAEVVVEGRMRTARAGEELLWRRRIVETDGARTELEALGEEGQRVEGQVRRTLRAAGLDLARDLLKPLQRLQPKPLLPPEM